MAILMDSHWLYFFTTLFFAGLGNARVWYKHGRFLKRHWRYILIFVIVTLPITAFEYFARRWGAWNYYPNHVLNAHLFGAEIETYLFMALVAAALAGAAFTYAQAEDDRRAKKRSSKRRRLTPRKASLAAGAARR